MYSRLSTGVSCENDVPCACGFVIRGNYAWSKREPSHRQLENEHAPTQIRQAYERGRHVYGSPRVLALAGGMGHSLFASVN